jgi:hypothetical protein
MFKTRHRQRTWGFRFSLRDLIILIVVVAGAGWLWYLKSPLCWLLLIAVGHFFLFCNVFRIIRWRELLWAGLFIVNVGFWILLERLTLPNVLASQIPITLFLIVGDIRSPGYHGIFARRLNPRLSDYLEGII